MSSDSAWTVRNFVFHFVPYIIIAIALGVGLHLNSDHVRNLESETRRATAQEAHLAYELCLTAQRNRETLRELIIGGEPLPIPVGADPSLVDAINNANARAVIVRQQQLEKLGPEVECVRPKKLPN